MWGLAVVDVLEVVLEAAQDAVLVEVVQRPVVDNVQEPVQGDAPAVAKGTVILPVQMPVPTVVKVQLVHIVSRVLEDVRVDVQGDAPVAVALGVLAVVMVVAPVAVALDVLVVVMVVALVVVLVVLEDAALDAPEDADQHVAWVAALIVVVLVHPDAQPIVPRHVLLRVKALKAHHAKVAMANVLGGVPVYVPDAAIHVVMVVPVVPVDVKVAAAVALGVLAAALEVVLAAAEADVLVGVRVAVQGDVEAVALVDVMADVVVPVEAVVLVIAHLPAQRLVDLDVLGLVTAVPVAVLLVAQLDVGLDAEVDAMLLVVVVVGLDVALDAELIVRALALQDVLIVARIHALLHAMGLVLPNVLEGLNNAPPLFQSYLIFIFLAVQ